MAAWVVPIVTSVIAAVAVFAAAYYTESFPRRVCGETELRVACASRARARSFLADCPVELTKRPWRDAFPQGT